MSTSRALFTREEVIRMRAEAAEITRRYERNLPARPTEEVAPASERHARAAAMIDDAYALVEAGRLAEALLKGEAAMGIAPVGSAPRADASALVGEVRLRQGNPQAARTAFNQALLIEPAHMGAHMGLAAAYRHSQRPRDAVPLYLESIALSVDEKEQQRLRTELAECYREMGEPEQARRVLLVAEPETSSSTLLTLLLPATRSGWLRWVVALAVAAFAIINGQLWLGVAVVLLALLWPLVRIGLRQLRQPPTDPHP